MKFTAAAIVVLALVIGIVPMFTDCQSQGKSIELANGKQIAMKCHWTARGELALAVPLLATGIMLGVSRRKEAVRVAAGTGVLLGAVAALIPTQLIGVCSSDMICHTLMQPTLVLSGALVIGVSAVGLIVSERRREDAL